MDLSINGPKEFITLYIGNFELPLVTQTTITLIITTVALIILSLVVYKNVKKRPGGFQVIVEKLVTMLYDMVEETMGRHNLKFAPFIGTLFVSSFFGSILGMTGVLRSSTADLSVTMAWALVTTGLVWYHSIKAKGFGGWLKGFTEPIVVMTPMNIVSEIAQPLSMAFRHFGNMVGGSVLTALIYGALSAVTNIVFGWLPEAVLSVFPPIFQAGIPAILSIYFDVFSGFVQAFIFCLLTMVYVGTACPPPEESEQLPDAAEPSTESGD
ncbi:MAG: F0F1 ATP synthase subunit A [Clostridia bacterium]|nr:F0F1 ATP synthase subunit A [Clostridia bacterium]